MNKKEKIMELDKLTLDEFLKDAAERFASQPALSLLDSEPLTYSDVRANAEKTAARLAARGIGKGSTVAVLGENMPNWVVSYFGIVLTGATAVPILPDFNDSEIENIIRHAECSFIFVSEKLFPKVEDLCRKNLPYANMETLEFTDEKESGKEGSYAYSPVTIEEDDVASIIYTSGTTGSSKGVMLTHKNMVSNALAASVIPEMEKRDRLVSILPLSHTYEFTIGMLVPYSVGAAIYYIGKPPVPNILLPALKKIRPGVMLSVPLLIEKIYRQKIYKTFTEKKLMAKLYAIPFFRKLLNRIAGKKLKKLFGGRIYFFGIGGAPLAPDVEKFLIEGRFPYAIGYGLTETSPLIAGDNAVWTRYRSTGRVLKGVEVKIDKSKGEGGSGEILVKGPNVMKGYYKDEKLTEEVFTPDGWFRTGDLGELADNGYLYIKGRIKNMILGPSGENIYPESIESIINTCAFVEDSVVIEDKGVLVALVHFNYDDMKKKFEDFKEEAMEGGRHLQEFMSRHIADIKKSVNSQLNNFSKISAIHEFKNPFEKTPTKKIKRYLYQNLKFLERSEKREE